MTAGNTLDLVVLVPGKDEKAALEALLEHRCESLGIRRVTFRIVVHPGRDPGCFQSAGKLLASFLGRADRALVVFDHEGSGQEARPAEDVAGEVRERLREAGWETRAEVAILVPELEAWIWSPSPHVDRALGWYGKDPTLRKWLVEEGWQEPESPKPDRPKEAVQAALREVRMQRSSALYGEVARRVSLGGCTDPSFGSLQEILAVWFPPKE